VQLAAPSVTQDGQSEATTFAARKLLSGQQSLVLTADVAETVEYSVNKTPLP